MSKRKSTKKPPFNPFARLGQYTAPLPDPGAPQFTSSAEFHDMTLAVGPPLPKVEVSIRIQFRCSVPIVEGDTITITLPNFKGPAGMFSLESRPHPDGLNTARCFQAYWSGGDRRPGAGKNGMPSKQVLVLRCIQRIEESTLALFAVPLSVGIISPDKLAANSVKVKIEGKLRHAEGGKIPKQSFLSCTEIRKKVPIIEELEMYHELIGRFAETSNISKNDRLIGEELSLEEVDQILEASQRRCSFPVSMQWPIATSVFREYDDAGGFVKKIMENAVTVIKKHDFLAIHREVARNWGVKVAAVVLLEDAIAMRHLALYPGVSRAALLAAHLITMEPVDVACTFPVTEVPKYSIQQELTSAFRTRDLLGGGSEAAAADGAAAGEATAVASAAGATATSKSSAAAAGSSMVPAAVLAAAAGTANRCETLLSKWSALIAALLTASIPAIDSGRHAGRGEFDDIVENIAIGDATSGGAAEGEDTGKPTVRFTSPPHEEGNVLLLPPPPLYVGIRDVSAADLAYLRKLHRGELYVFPGFTVARQGFGLFDNFLPGGSPGSPRFDDESRALSSIGRSGNVTLTSPPSADAGDGDASDISVDIDSIPDNAVVFELFDVAEALELADVSMHPCNREWLLPLSSSFRVRSITVRSAYNDVTHVQLEMVGSLVGTIGDELIPEGDQAVASMLLKKIRLELENAEAVTQAIASLTYLNVRLNDRRRLHPPTLMRAQYLTNYQEVKRASEAKQTVEESIVVWQVCTHPPQMLEHGVVKPATWEALPKKIAPQVELFFLGRSRTRRVMEEGTLVLNLTDFTIDYAGKGVRPIRRLVGKRVTHEAPLSSTYYELKEKQEATAKQLMTLDVKLGIAPSPNATLGGTRFSMGSSKSKGSSSKPGSARQR